jgi:hypothetical protein
MSLDEAQQVLNLQPNAPWETVLQARGARGAARRGGCGCGVAPPAARPRVR